MPVTDDYALVIGINDYKNQPYGPLEGAKRDAEEFIKWLKSPTGADLAPANVDPFIKLSDDAGTEPTSTHFWKLLNDLRKRAPQGKKRVGRRLYIFLAGHGVSPKDDIDEAGLVAVEAEETLSPYLGGKLHADLLCLCGRFEEVVLFMDCCRITGLLVAEPPQPFAEKQDPAAAAKSRRFYAFATAMGQVAREALHDGKMRGTFSRVLLDGLNGGVKPDSQGRLTTTQLRAYLEDRMKGIVISGEVQTPKFPATEEIVLVEGLAPQKTAVTLTLTQPVYSIAVLDGGDNFAPVPPDILTHDATTIRFLVPAGKSYAIHALDAGGKQFRTVLVRAATEEVHETL